jgi:hypothetical protein
VMFFGVCCEFECGWWVGGWVGGWGTLGKGGRCWGVMVLMCVIWLRQGVFVSVNGAFICGVDDMAACFGCEAAGGLAAVALYHCALHAYAYAYIMRHDLMWASGTRGPSEAAQEQLQPSLLQHKWHPSAPEGGKKAPHVLGPGGGSLLGSLLAALLCSWFPVCRPSDPAGYPMFGRSVSSIPIPLAFTDLYGASKAQVCRHLQISGSKGGGLV